MPELPEVETTVKGLNILIGLKVYKVKIHTKKLRYIIPKSIIKIQKDSKITNIQRIAKYILIHFLILWKEAMLKQQIIFNSSPKPTIGVEVELQTLDSKTLSPMSGAPILLKK